MKIKIPIKIKLALAKYYHGRNRADLWEAKDGLMKVSLYLTGKGTWSSDEPKKPEWDKEAALKHIEEVTSSIGWSFAASAGTFWLTRGKHTIKANEDTYLYI